MFVRITPQTVISEALNSSSRISSRLADLQRQASTGLRIERPSDSPGTIGELLSRKIDHSRLETDQENVSSTTTRLNHSVSQLLQINQGLVRAKEIALEAPQSQSRDTLANEINSLLDRVFRLANGQDGSGQYLYSGAAVEAPPFEAVRSPNGEIISVQYNGSDQPTSVSVGTLESVEINEAGSQLFGLSDRGATLFTGTTGAAAGFGTDSGVGVQSLNVRHTSTLYAGASGVLAGTSSPAGDTILGPAGAHTLTINDTSGSGTSGTISLNGGPPVAFTSTDSNLRVDGPGGDVVYVDTTSIASGFSGTVDITSNGTLSTDNGSSVVPIEFSSNQQVIDSQTGHVTNVDSLLVRSTGEEQIEFEGTTGLFGSLIQLRDDLRNARGLSESELQGAFSRRLGDVDRVRDDLLAGVGRQSFQLENLEAIDSHIDELKLQAAQRVSELESADLTAVLLNLQSEQNLLQATYSTLVRTLDQSLVDFLS